MAVRLTPSVANFDAHPHKSCRKVSAPVKAKSKFMTLPTCQDETSKSKDVALLKIERIDVTFATFHGDTSALKLVAL